MFITLSKHRLRWFILTLLLSPSMLRAQSDADSVLAEATIDAVVRYALQHQPFVRQAQADEEITNSVIRGKLADWYPQINFTYNYQRYFDLQSSIIGGNVIRFGVNNTSSAQFTATQNIFNRDVLLASSTATKVRAQASLNTS
ncbi:MAG: TolC family protein, partial [Bacteroidia bacterium]|nr:TolC family protein [Bacteroidia bacterium]